MVLNEFGEIAYREWVKLPERFPTVELDVFQIMPNHMHGIIILTESTGDGVGDGRVRVNRTPTVGNDVGATVGATLAATVGATLAATVGATLAATVGATVGATLAVALSGDGRARFTRAPTVGDIVGAYKSLVANACLAMYQSKNETMGKLWQRNYYEHIIRHESAYHNISNYIIHNPSHWIEDRFYF
jgi:REP element-mobilizing transposase RayT